MLKGLSEKDLDTFLVTLDDNRGIAAEKYIGVRERLERFFEWRGLENSEELTDIVFDRVVKKIIDGEKIENAEAYCVSVAKFVLLEGRRENFKTTELNEDSSQASFEQDTVDERESKLKDIQFTCLDKCLSELPVDKRELLVGYFDTDQKTMISTRKNLANEVGINLNSLRIRISRLKTKLEKCVKECCEKT